MSNEISMQKTTSGSKGIHEQNSNKGCTISAPLPDLTTFSLYDLDSMSLDSATVLALAKAFPEWKEKIFIKFLLGQGVQPFEGTPFTSAGIINFLTEKWTFKAKPEMELLLNLAKLQEMTQAPTRLASLAHWEQKLQEMEESESDAELMDKQVTIVVTDIDGEDKTEEPKEAEDSGKLEKAWGKGVGYGSEYTGDTQDWDPVGWKINSLAQDKGIVELLDKVMASMSEEFAHEFISESSVIPVLLSYLQNDSFHDINSKPALYTSIFKCILGFVNNMKFLPLLFDNHGSTVAERVCKIGRQAEQVVKMGETVEDSTEDDSTRLSILIKDVYNSLTSSIEELMTALRVSQALTRDTTDLGPLLAKVQDLRESLNARGEEPVVDLLKKQDATNEDYEAIMRELCFGSIEEMAGFGPHHYKNQDVLVKRKLMKRLAGEFADFQYSLPIHHESSVLFRFCEEKMSHAQILIIPADGTPYAAGCFIFDIKFPANYPNSPPKVNLQTTGHGAVRFNPNLYNCGKVCLSLLGTWDAYSQAEKWNAEVSTFLQVAISIQSLIFVPEPYYNEPSYEDDMGTEWGNQQSHAYNVNIQKGTTKYAMIEMLEKPPAAWKDVIEAHFTLQGDRVLKNVTEWLGADHQDTKKLASLLSNLQSKQIESSEEEAMATRNLGA